MFMCVRKCAGFLHISTRQVYRLIKIDKKFPVRRHGKSIRFLTTDLMSYSNSTMNSEESLTLSKFQYAKKCVGSLKSRDTVTSF